MSSFSLEIPSQGLITGVGRVSSESVSYPFVFSVFYYICCGQLLTHPPQFYIANFILPIYAKNFLQIFVDKYLQLVYFIALAT